MPLDIVALDTNCTTPPVEFPPPAPVVPAVPTTVLLKRGRLIGFAVGVTVELPRTIMGAATEGNTAVVADEGVLVVDRTLVSVVMLPGEAELGVDFFGTKTRLAWLKRAWRIQPIEVLRSSRRHDTIANASSLDWSMRIARHRNEL